MSTEEGKELNSDQTAEETTQSGSPVTDDDLSRAWEEAEPEQQAATEDVKEEAKEPATEGDKQEEPPAEPEKPPKEGDEEHKERTKLGRKVAKLEDTLSQVLEQNRILLEKLTSPPQQATAQEEQEYVDLSSPEGLDRFLAQREVARTQQATQEQVKYQSGYLTSIKGWQETTEDEGEAADIYKMLTDTKSPFNVRYSADPNADFERNLSKATAHYWKTKATSTTAKRENPLDKNKAVQPKSPLGVAGDSKSEAAKAAPTVKLDKESEELVKRWGWTPEQVAEALKGEAPMHLRRGR